jgi:protein-S-isoprenylcysteine O-methyltransferase Ste14
MKQANRYTARVKARLISIVILIGIVVLFFFPSPESNFLAYAGTVLFFVLLIVFLLKWHRKKK